MDGPPEDFEALFRSEFRAVIRAVLPIVGEATEAEAITQEAFLKALTRWGRVRRYDRPGAWVRRVAIRDAVRSAERTRRPPLAERAPTTSVDLAADRIDLVRALQQVSPRQRAAVALHHLGGWPVAEVAESLGCSEATVRVHLHRGRAALAEILGVTMQEANDGP
jgi:RNA polymerase sigma-70 factor (ECF subfamily)